MLNNYTFYLLVLVVFISTIKPGKLTIILRRTYRILGVVSNSDIHN